MAFRDDFPFFHHAPHVAFLDNAASVQKPKVVLDSMMSHYVTQYSNVYRSAHYYDEKSTEAIDQTRQIVKNFLNAKKEEEIVFTSGTTESMNLVAQGWGLSHVNAEDEILITQMEHHSNILPWQRLAKQRNAILKIIPLTPEGKLDLQAGLRLISQKTKILSIVHLSHVLGIFNELQPFIEKVHQVGGVVCVDAAQSASHTHMDVQAMDCDFLAFSGHKIYGPTGVGVLYGKYHLLQDMQPFKVGSSAILKVSFSDCSYKEPPACFEPGTPPIIEIAGLGSALTYFIDRQNAIFKQEKELIQAAMEALKTIADIMILGSDEKTSIISFNIPQIHAHDIATVCNANHVCVRSGDHCAQPLMRFFGVSGAIRISLACYNTMNDIDQCMKSIQTAIKIFKS